MNITWSRDVDEFLAPTGNDCRLLVAATPPTSYAKFGFKHVGGGRMYLRVDEALVRDERSSAEQTTPALSSHPAEVGGSGSPAPRSSFDLRHRKSATGQQRGRARDRWITRVTTLPGVWKGLSVGCLLSLLR